MINHYICTGRLSADPDLRTTNSGISFCRFTVAVERPRRQGQESAADFIRCVAWRQTADFIGKYFRKGRWICVEGALQQNRYTDENGERRSVYEVVAERAHFCGDRKSERAAIDDAAPDEDDAPYAGNAGPEDFMSIEPVEDDLPW